MFLKYKCQRPVSCKKVRISGFMRYRSKVGSDHAGTLCDTGDSSPNKRKNIREYLSQPIDKQNFRIYNECVIRKNDEEKSRLQNDSERDI